MFTDKEKILEQYHNANNLESRIALHKRFSTAKHDYHLWIFDQLQAPKNAKVLELGTGSAKLWQVNRGRVPTSWQVVLSDISQGMLNDARTNVADVSGTFSFYRVDAQAIPFEDSSFDLVIANHMLYHVPDVDKAVAEIRHVLKPTGRFYAATGGLKHMQELDNFVATYMASQLPGVFERMDTITQQFALENGREKLSKHFKNIAIHLPPESHLHITEADPFIAYILSMARWSMLVEQVSKEYVDEVVANARKTAKDNLPIQITTSAGLFEAY